MDKGLLNEATSTDDSPTPGYMLTEISRATLVSYPGCVQLIEFLNARLKKNNHNVKYKCLIIIKHVCRTGRGDFKKDMARNLDAVKECLQYKGPPDPLRGDEIYKRVRDAAKDALDAIFDSQMPVSSSSVASRIQGMGGGSEDAPAPGRNSSTQQSSSVLSGFSFSSFGGGSDGASYTGHPGAGNSDSLPTTKTATGSGGYDSSSRQSASSGGWQQSSSSGMTGIGNPNFKDARNEVSFMQRMAAMAEGASEKLSFSSSEKEKNKDRPSLPPSGTGNAPAWGDYQMRSNRGGPDYPGSQPSYSPSAGTQPGATDNVSGRDGFVPDIPSLGGGMGRAGHAASDGAYEQSLVSSLCEPGGMKAVPPQDKLASFLSAAPTLSAELVGTSLLDCLNSDSWQSRAKALAVVGSLGVSSGCGSHSSWWKENGADDLFAVAAGDSKASVRSQATKALRALGISVEGKDVTPAKRTVGRTSTAVDTPSLIQFDDCDGNSAPVPAQSHPLAGPSLLDLFDSSDSAPASSGPIERQSSSQDSNGLFAGMAVGASSVQDPKLQTPVSQFLDSIDSSVPADSAPPPPAATSSSSTSGFDFMSPSLTQPDPAISPPSPSGGQGRTQPPVDLSGLNLTSAPQQQYQYPMGQPQQRAQQYTPIRPSAMGAMSPQMGSRKVIPDSASGFGFLGEGGRNQSPDDAFSFVKDAMKSSGGRTK
mmetsp:Transcript_16816/g.25277  ORF Transcript_16816/g.25277 Transcript_16816/m.25277 type:complete len:704 (-) Transcript_16816:165-2276(-)|eukprot:CAMPEP_0185035966 /NCGR_PEP_ID=MMETSP1103-20130426/28239_1 /TAXON_ID=36769 /ORGANISM="Paraphysomonas bandaiensis, Strain Caron Lab Isolate" /LENGTH=703 /DNA_ID=CAMNT_0027573297 /DNA_START=77 /DNA_END=2188 /DNA_ORIENTATION=+